MTTEMLSSDEPCAVATTFIPLLPSDLKRVADIPGVFFIFSPTMAIIDIFFSTIILSSLFLLISAANSVEMASIAGSLSDGLTARVIEYSEEAWVMKITLTSLFASAPNNLADVPFTPTITGPWRDMRSM